MIVQISEKESIDIPISLTEVAQKIYEQNIEIEKLQEENKEWIKDAGILAEIVKDYFEYTKKQAETPSHPQGDGCYPELAKCLQLMEFLQQHKELVDKYM